MQKKIKIVDVNASVSEPAEASVVIVEADPVVEIPNEEPPVQVLRRLHHQRKEKGRNKLNQKQLLSLRRNEHHGHDP
jgi:hypothetical protein